MSIKVLAWKTVLSCLFLFLLGITFIHPLCEAALAIMAVTSVSFQQASPSVLQQPFFPPLSAAYYRLPPTPHFHFSVRSFFSTTFSTFLFVNKALVNAALFKLMRQEKGVCLSACHTSGSKKQHCFHCTVHTKPIGFSGCAFCFRKTSLHNNDLVESSYFGFLPSKNMWKNS